MSTPFADPIIILNELTSAPTPPVRNSGNGWGVVPISWRRGSVDTFALEMYARGSNAVTVAHLIAGIPEPLATLADVTVTAASFASSKLTSTAHGLSSGDGPIYLTNSGGALPAGLFTNKPYWLSRFDADNVLPCDSLVNALNAVPVTFTDAGSGTNKITKSTNTDDPTRRIQMLDCGLLGPAGDGSITLTVAMGYTVRVKHNPRAALYAIVATFGSAVATTVTLAPMPLAPRG